MIMPINNSIQARGGGGVGACVNAEGRDGHVMSYLKVSDVLL